MEQRDVPFHIQCSNICNLESLPSRIQGMLPHHRVDTFCVPQLLQTQSSLMTMFWWVKPWSWNSNIVVMVEYERTSIAGKLSHLHWRGGTLNLQPMVFGPTWQELGANDLVRYCPQAIIRKLAITPTINAVSNPDCVEELILLKLKQLRDSKIVPCPNFWQSCCWFGQGSE